MNANAEETVTESVVGSPLLALTVREISERWPESMRVLAPLGIDLCCGGGRQLGEALTLHNADVDTVVEKLARIGAPPEDAR